MKWIFYVIVFIYMFYRAVYGIKEFNSLSIETINYGEGKTYYTAGIRKTISCKGVSKNQKVEWIDPNGNVVKRVATNRVFVQEHFIPKSSFRARVPALVLVFTHLIVEDSGIWVCRSGDVVQKVSLCVIDPSKFVDTLKEVSVDRGRSITLSCQARGEPEPRLIWLRNEELITEDSSLSKYKVMTKYNSQGFEGLLTINSLEPDDSDLYTCEAIQESPHDESCINVENFNITLQVNYAPEFADGNDTKIVYQQENESVDLVCSANGFPKPSYRWFQDLGETFSEFPEKRVSLQEDGTKAVLTVAANVTSSVDRYRCRATNQYGEADKVFAIVKLEPPEQPNKISVQNKYHDRIQFYVTWSEEMSFPVDEIEVQYLEKKIISRKHAGNPREADWKKAEEVKLNLDDEAERDVEGIFVTLSDLEAETGYWVRLRAINMAGESPWSEPVPVFTSSIPESDSHVEEETEDSSNTTTTVNAELLTSDGTFYGIFFTGGIIVIAIVCMFAMRMV